MPNAGDSRLSGVIQNELVIDEIRFIVAEAILSGEVLPIRAHVERLAQTYGTSGFSRGGIANELILAAARAQVPVEMDVAA